MMCDGVGWDGRCLHICSFPFVAVSFTTSSCKGRVHGLVVCAATGVEILSTGGGDTQSVLISTVNCTDQYRVCTDQYRVCTDQYSQCTDQYSQCISHLLTHTVHSLAGSRWCTPLGGRKAKMAVGQNSNAMQAVGSYLHRRHGVYKSVGRSTEACRTGQK